MNKIVVLLTVAALFSFNTAFAGMTGNEGDNLRDLAANGSINAIKKYSMPPILGIPLLNLN